MASSIKELCQKAGPELVAELMRLAMHGRSEMTRIAAAKELLDRGYGKPKMSVAGEVLFGVSAELQRLLDQHDGRSRSIPDRSPTTLMALNGAVAPAPPKEEPDATGNGTAEVH